MDGTQIAVKIPSILWPLNHKYPETKNEIITASKKKKSDFLNILYVSFAWVNLSNVYSLP